MKILAGLLSAVVCVNVHANSDIINDYARVVIAEPIVKSNYRTVPRTSCAMIQTQGSGVSTERCSTYYDKEFFNTVTGYNVTIEYEGVLRTVRLHHNPGTRVAVRVVKQVQVLE